MKTTGFRKRTATVLLQILQMTSKLLKLEVLSPVNWRNTTRHVTCDSVEEQRDTEKLFVTFVTEVSLYSREAEPQIERIL